MTKELVRQARYSPKIVQHVLGHSHPGVALEHYNRVVGEDLAAAVFDPVPGGSLDIPLDKSGKEKDATSAEVAS